MSVASPAAPPIVTDWGRLQRARVASVHRPASEAELCGLVSKAAASGSKLSLRGCGHSAGAQSFSEGAAMIDMRGLDRILDLDQAGRTVRVQSGATWATLTKALEPLRLGPTTKQEFETFTIGGTLAANAHGKSIDRGPIIGGVRSLRLLLADGRLLTASREENAELFRAAIGGYGLLGPIVDATLELIDDLPVQNSERAFMDAGPLIEAYVERIADRERTPLCYGFLDGECRRGFYVAYTYTDDGRTFELDQLERREPPPALFDALVWMQRRSALVRRATLRGMWAESRFSETTLRSRRLLLWDEPPKALTGTLLQKYIVPIERFAGFLGAAGTTLRRYRARLPQFPPHFRFVPGGDEALLPLAPDDAICLILCHLAEPADPDWRQSFERATSELLEACLEHGGHHYLTFDAIASRAQLLRAYPNWEKFVELKHREDPEGLFTSGFFERYGAGR